MIPQSLPLRKIGMCFLTNKGKGREWYEAESVHVIFPYDSDGVHPVRMQRASSDRMGYDYGAEHAANAASGRRRRQRAIRIRV